MKVKILMAMVGSTALLLLTGGCSTWRCRGFVDSRESPVTSPKGTYVLQSIEFRNSAMSDEALKNRSPRLAWLSARDAMVGTSYLEDIGKVIGMTNEAAASPQDVVKVFISIVPYEEARSGGSSVAWPLCGTLGVFPAHFVEEVPFDVIIRFDKHPNGRLDLPESSFATASMGLLQVDYQCGLTRMDMDAPPEAQSAVGEIRDDGTVGTGRELRQERFREVFVKTVAAVVLRAIAEREKSECEQVAQPSTEFGPVKFPQLDLFERTKTRGWGKSPDGDEVPVPETFEQYMTEVWKYPKTKEEIMLKRAVDSGIMTRNQWESQIRDVWKRKNK